jgi:hypothetical protein
MMLFDKIRENAEGLRLMGERAVEQAARAGVAAYYMDPAHGEDIIREFPDGRRERIRWGHDSAPVPIEPRLSP